MLAAGVAAVFLLATAVLAWRSAPPRNPKQAVSPQVADLCAKARFFWNKRTPEVLRTSLELYQQAIRFAPGYAPAYAGEASCYAVMAVNSQLPADLTARQAIEAANEAIALDPNVAEAHAALGLVAFGIRYDWGAAESELSRALALDPNMASAHKYRALCRLYTGRTAEAQAEMRKALELDPLSVSLRVGEGMLSYYLRHYHQAVEKAHQILEMDPAFRDAHLMLGLALEGLRDWTGAEREYNVAALASTGDCESIARLAHVYARSGRTRKAREILDRLLKPAPDQCVDPYQVAFVYTALGQTGPALEWLEKAVRQHTAIPMKVDPYLDPLRGDPGYQKLLARAHLN